jgi:RNA polymerase sigma-70 factor (sigma-E family)
VASDDRDAFTAWAVGRQQALFRTAYLLSGDRHRAEDLLQETMLKVAARWSRLRDGDPDAYARTILVRDNISWWRRLRRETVVATPPDRPSGDTSDVSDRRIAVAKALDCLTPRQRAVLVLRYYDDLTEQQTAAALGVSLGTVKAHAHHGLARLREAAPELAQFLDRTTRPGTPS